MHRLPALFLADFRGAPDPFVVESQERKKWSGGKSRSTCKVGCCSPCPKIEVQEEEEEGGEGGMGQAKGGALGKSREHSDGDAFLLDGISATGRKGSSVILEGTEENAGNGRRGVEVTEGREVLKGTCGAEDDYLEAGSRILEGEMQLEEGEGEGEGEECIICQEEYQEGEEVTVLPCKHEFHVTCVVPWLEKHHTCPTCRHELDQEGPSQHEVSHAPSLFATNITRVQFSNHLSSCAIFLRERERQRKEREREREIRKGEIRICIWSWGSTGACTE
jgi:hypothetical protein